MIEEIAVLVVGVVLTAQTAMIYNQNKILEKLITPITIICREHHANHGGEVIKVD